MDRNNNPKTWTLAQRARKVSKGQAKIFMTRNAGDEQRLSKLTQLLDKEKLAKTSELKFAQKLLVKRYGPGKSELDNAEEPRRVSRERSVTFDSTFITRPDVIVDGRDPISLERKISSAESLRSRDVHRKISNTHSPGWEEKSRKLSTTQPLGRIIRKVSAPHFLGTGEIAQAVSTDKQVPLNRFSRSHWDDLHVKRRSRAIGSLDREEPREDTQANRPRAISLTLPPLILPPIYKTNEKESNPAGGGLRSTSHIRTTSQETGQARKTSLGSNRYSTGSTAVDGMAIVELDDSLYSCRYLRRKNDDDDYI